MKNPDVRFLYHVGNSIVEWAEGELTFEEVVKDLAKISEDIPKSLDAFFITKLLEEINYDVDAHIVAAINEGVCRYEDELTSLPGCCRDDCGCGEEGGCKCGLCRPT